MLPTKKERNYKLNELKIEKRNKWAAWLQSTKNMLPYSKTTRTFSKIPKNGNIVSTKYTRRKKKKKVNIASYIVQPETTSN